MSGRKRRREDGTLRPTIVRRRRRLAAARAQQRDAGPERAAWLAQFAPGERDRFFKNIVLKDAVFLAAFTAELGLPREEAAVLLERTGNERGWRKLRTRDGLVVGIAPPRRRREVSEPGATSAAENTQPEGTGADHTAQAGDAEADQVTSRPEGTETSSAPGSLASHEARAGASAVEGVTPA